MSMVMGGGRHARSRAPRNVRGPLLAFAVGGIEFVIAWVATASVVATVSISAAVLLIAACFVWPAAVMTTAFPASFATWRVGPAAIDMSAADLIAFLGAIASLPFVPWHGKAFRSVLLATAGYCAVVSIAVVAHPSSSAAIEVVHRFVMVMGAVCIGAAVVRKGHVTAALRSLVLAACVFAIAAVVDTLSHGFRPAYAFGIQKNAMGSLLVSTIIVVFIGGRYLRWNRSQVALVGIVLMCGLAATQSRGAGIALIAVALVFIARNAWLQRTVRLRRVLPIMVILGLALTLAMVQSFSTEAQQHQGSDAKYGSVGSRTATYDVVWNQVIRPHPILGFGPKWFSKPGAVTNEPHNFVLDELASTGFVGLAGFGLLVWVLLQASHRTKSLLGEMAWYVLVARLVADLFDIFWVAGPNTLPFLILGLAVGAASLEQERSAPHPELALQ